MKEIREFDINNIVISDHYRSTLPGINKMLKKAATFVSTGEFESNIVIDENNVLVDGFTSYLIARIYKLATVPVCKGAITIVTGRHNKRGEGKLYKWYLPENLRNKAKQGSRIKVGTSKGIKYAYIEDVLYMQGKPKDYDLREVLRVY